MLAGGRQHGWGLLLLCFPGAVRAFYRASHLLAIYGAYVAGISGMKGNLCTFEFAVTDRLTI